MASEHKAEEAEEVKAQQNTDDKKAPKQNSKGIFSLYNVGKGRREKKQGMNAKKIKKKAPGLIRVQVDLDELEIPHNATLLLPDKENLQAFKVAVVPDSGYWKGATYTFNFVIPDNYPYKPPKVTCDEKIYHPNIDLQGNVCLNLLKADWRPILTVQQVIHGLIFLFLVCSPDILLSIPPRS